MKSIVTLPVLWAIANDPFLIGEEEVFITLKIGVIPFEGNLINSEELIRYADTAMSDAKKRAGNALSFFTVDQDEESKRELSIINHLSHALQKDEFLRACPTKSGFTYR